MNSLDELILKWQEGNLDGAELRQLNALLARAENRQVLREEFLLSAGLRADAQARAGKIVPMERVNPARGNTWRWIGGMAAAVLFCALLVRLWLGPDSVLVAGTGEKLTPGQFLQTSESEEREITFDDGRSRMRLHGSSRLAVVSLGGRKEFRLEQGTVVANIAPQENPLLIHTAQAEAIVLGTEFILSALPRSTRLDVAEGTVRFKRTADGHALEVRGNQFAAVSPELAFATQPLPPSPWREGDIGAVQLHGAAFVNSGKCLIKGAGRNTCLKKDQVHFMYQKTTTDFDFRARLVSFNARSESARAGLMVRRSLKSACRQAFIAFRGDQKIEIQCRPEAESHELFVTTATLPVWLRVVRQGDTLRFLSSADGNNWRELASETVAIGETAFSGLAVTSFNNEVLDESVFDNVALFSARAL